MGTISYEQSAYEVRGDLAAAHARAWERLSNDVRSAPSAKKPDRRLRSTAGTIPPPHCLRRGFDAGLVRANHRAPDLGR